MTWRPVDQPQGGWSQRWEQSSFHWSRSKPRAQRSRQIWSPWKSLVVLKITLHKDSRLRWQFRRAKHRCRPEAQWSPCSHLFIFSIITTFIVDMKTNVMILQILQDESMMTIPVPPHLRGLGTQLTRCWGLSSIRSWVLKMDQFNIISTYF